MLNILLFALLFAFAGTKNGRKLAFKTVRSFIPKTPFFIRRLALLNPQIMPNFIHRRMIFLTTCPITQQDKSWLHIVSKDTWKGVWVVPNLKNVNQVQESAPEQDLVILYTHGGGFTVGYSYMHLETFQSIINKLKDEHNIRASILTLEYSLSPEHRWPKACTEAVDCYRYLIHDLGISPSKVILAGDSAGGNLVATTLLQLKDLKEKKSNDLPPLPYPKGAALLSPWIDLTVQEYPPLRDTLTAELLEFFKKNYVTSANQLQDALVSPVNGDFSRIPCPLFVAYGSEEILKPCIEKFISNLKRDDCRVTVLKGGENTTHIWLVSNLMATSRAVYEKDCHAFVEWVAESAQMTN